MDSLLEWNLHLPKDLYGRGGRIVAPESFVITCRRIADHFGKCDACGLAGGEQADPDDLCATGMELFRSRDDAEKRLIFQEVSAYHA